MNIQKIMVTDFYTLHKLMVSSSISNDQKAKFIMYNQAQIKQILANANISAIEFYNIMKNRPLVKFRPLKNSFTKRGDKILVAKTLGIEPEDVDSYIKTVTSELQDIDDLDFLPEDKIYAIKTYVYRHGSKDQLVAFLDYELTKTQDVLKTLYRTLEYNTGGVADYFVRPIHRFDNRTLINIYNVIDKHLDKVQIEGDCTDEQKTKIAKWALVRIYQIQNNNKFKNAIKTKNILSN